MPAFVRVALTAACLMLAADAVSIEPFAGKDLAATDQPIEDPLVDIEHGKPNELVDGVGWVLGMPRKLLLWDRRADNHDVSADTVSEAAALLTEGEVEGVKIRVNQWDPLGEWRRLAENDRVGLGWRATFGTAYTLGYSVLPGRLIGGDWYNPFTDTVHVYSDVPALAMEQAAQARDTHERTHPGLYSAVRVLPFVGLVHEARSKQQVFDHVDRHGTPEEQAEARRVLHPQMGAEVGGQAAVFIPQGEAILAAGGAVIGHAVGRIQAAKIESHDGAIDEAPPAPEFVPAPAREPNRSPYMSVR